MTETFMPVESRRIDDTILQEMAPLDIAEDRSSVGLLVSIWPWTIRPWFRNLTEQGRIAQLFRILNLGHWDLFEICILLFGI